MSLSVYEVQATRLIRVVIPHETTGGSEMLDLPSICSKTGRIPVAHSRRNAIQLSLY